MFDGPICFCLTQLCASTGFAYILNSLGFVELCSDYFVGVSDSRLCFTSLLHTPCITQKWVTVREWVRLPLFSWCISTRRYDDHILISTIFYRPHHSSLFFKLFKDKNMNEILMNYKCSFVFVMNNLLISRLFDSISGCILGVVYVT